MATNNYPKQIKVKHSNVIAISIVVIFFVVLVFAVTIDFILRDIEHGAIELLLLFFISIIVIIFAGNYLLNYYYLGFRKSLFTIHEGGLSFHYLNDGKTISWKDIDSITITKERYRKGGTWLVLRFVVNEKVMPNFLGMIKKTLNPLTPIREITTYIEITNLTKSDILFLKEHA